MAWLPIAAAGVSIFSNLTKASGQYQAAGATDEQGAAIEQSYIDRANQMRSNAGQQIAASQRGAMGDRTTAALAASKLIAAAGASGGTGPQVNRLVADIIAKGSFNSSMDIYNGEEKSRQMNADADAAVRQGRLERIGAGNKSTALRTQAGGSLLSAAAGAGTLFSKYGSSGKADNGYTVDGNPDTTPDLS